MASASTGTSSVLEKPFHPDFCSSTADFVVRSSDGIRFKCHRLFLQESSPVFRTMLTLPQPGTSTPPDVTSRPPSIDLPEDGKTLETLLRIIYPIPQPTIDSISLLVKAFLAAEKYDMQGSSRRYAFTCEMSASSLITPASLTTDIHDPSNLEIFEQTGFKVSDLISLHRLRHKRIDGMREFLDGDGFEGNAPDFACVSCSKLLQDPTWSLLKTSILKELYWRPLGDTIFGPEFLKSSAVQFFINSKCEECHERLVYEKGKTLAMISDFLRSLPEFIDISK
ncbi:hypothetical protein ACEPAH_467 [Sanghuangporus vaninii]